MHSLRKYYKNNDFIDELECKIGLTPLSDNEVKELMSLSMAGIKKAVYVYGLYLLIEKNDENGAICWLKEMNSRQ